MKYPLALIGLILTMSLLPGCRGDRENPAVTTDADRVMESYLLSVQKIGRLLADVQTETQAQTAAPRILLIVQDMRDLIPRMRKISEKDQANTISKYRVKSRNINEQFEKDITHFVTISGASEDLIRQLKNMPPMFEPADATP